MATTGSIYKHRPLREKAKALVPSGMMTSHEVIKSRLPASGPHPSTPFWLSMLLCDFGVVKAKKTKNKNKSVHWMPKMPFSFLLVIILIIACLIFLTLVFFLFYALLMMRRNLLFHCSMHIKESLTYRIF